MQELCKRSVESILITGLEEDQMPGWTAGYLFDSVVDTVFASNTVKCFDVFVMYLDTGHALILSSQLLDSLFTMRD